MPLVADGEHGCSAQLGAAEIVEESVGVLVARVVHIAQTGVPGDVESQAAPVIDGVEDARRKLEAHLHALVIVVDAVAEGNGEIGFLDVRFAEILDCFIEFAPYSEIKGWTEGNGYAELIAQKFAVPEE